MNVCNILQDHVLDCTHTPPAQTQFLNPNTQPSQQAWSVLIVPGDYTTLSCTTPIAPAACGKDTNITIFRMKAFCCDMEHVGSLLGESLRLRWLLGFCPRVNVADEVGSNWWPSEIQLWLLVRITTRELFNPDGPCGWVLEVAWSVLSVPGDYTTLSCTTPIAPAACGKDTNITIFRMKAFCCDMEHVGSLLGESLRLRWSLGFGQRVYMCADEVGSNWWPSEIQLWLLVRITTRELFNPDGPCGWVLEVAWSVLNVPGDYTTLSCTTPIAPAACGKGILLWHGACWVAVGWKLEALLIVGFLSKSKCGRWSGQQLMTIRNPTLIACEDHNKRAF